MSAEPETALYTKLAGTSAVTDLVGTRITPWERRQDASLPAVTYFRVSGGPINTLGGPLATNSCRIQVDSWASSYSGVKALAVVVRAALSGWTEAGDPEIGSCHLEDEGDILEGPEPGQDAFTYRVRQDYILWYL